MLPVLGMAFCTFCLVISASVRTIFTDYEMTQQLG